MIKRLTIVQGHPDVPKGEALRYWKEEHAALVARVPRVKRYVQNHCVDNVLGMGESSFVGLGEVWFETIEDAAEALESPEWKAVMEDAANFMDISRVSASWAREYELF